MKERFLLMLELVGKKIDGHATVLKIVSKSFYVFSIEFGDRGLSGVKQERDVERFPGRGVY